MGLMQRPLASEVVYFQRQDSFIVTPTRLSTSRVSMAGNGEDDQQPMGHVRCASLRIRRRLLHCVCQRLQPRRRQWVRALSVARAIMRDEPRIPQ
jgi:hypothetical protein